MTRGALVLSALVLPAGCLRPAGFPWDSSGDGAGSSDASSHALTSTLTSTADPTTGGAADPSSSGAPPPGSSSGVASSSTGQDTGGTGPASACGDGHLDAGEECDDGNLDDDDGCNAQCGRDRLIFVTSTIHAGDQIQGTAGGDTICNKAALAGGLAGPGGFKAWLSDRTTDATSRLTPGKGRYVRVDGLVVATTWGGLLDGGLDNPIVVTEVDTVYESGVWTGTRPDGTREVGADHCLDWTLADFLDPENGGFFGYAGAFDGVWTSAPDDINPGPCGGELALYCVEQ